MDFTFSEEQEMFRAMFRDFSAKEVAPRAEELDHEEQLPLATLRQAAQQGFLGATLPEDYFGAELDYELRFAHRDAGRGLHVYRRDAGDAREPGSDERPPTWRRCPERGMAPADGDRRNDRCLCPHRAGRRQRRGLPE